MNFFKTSLIILFLVSIPTFGFSAIHWNSSLGWSWSRIIVKPTPEEQLKYCLELEQNKKYTEAIANHRALIIYFPDSKEAVESSYKMGEILISNGKFNKAEKYFFNLINDELKRLSRDFKPLQKYRRKTGFFSKKEKDKNSEIMFQILLRNLDDEQSKLDINRIIKDLYLIGQAYEKGARYRFWGIPLWKQYGRINKIYRYLLRRAPNFEHSAKMQKSLALYHIRKKEYIEAILEMKVLLYEYTLSPEAQDVPYYLGLCHFKMSRGPGYNERNMENAIVNLNDYLISNPVGDKAASAKDIITDAVKEKSDSALIRIKFFIRRNQWSAVGIYIKNLLKEYPDSSAAKEALKLKMKYAHKIIEK